MLIRPKVELPAAATAAKRFRESSFPEGPSATSTSSSPQQSTNSPATAKPPQNRYEALFIKLFAQKTLQLIMSFAAVFLSVVMLRDLIGFRIRVFKISFWFQFFFNLALFFLLIFAKMKCISNKKTNPLSNPFEHHFNQDQLVLIGVWTVTAFGFGSWYFNQYASGIYKLFEHVKGKSYPMLREQYFLIWSTLLFQGLISWAASNYFACKKKAIQADASKVSLYRFLQVKIQNVAFWPNLLNVSVVCCLVLLFNHFFCAWISFPIFGMFFSTIYDLQQPIRHSWFAIFKLSLFINLIVFSAIANFTFAVIDWLIEFYLHDTFRTSTLVSDSERCLSVGLCQTRQNFIHLQACREFLDLATESNTFRRFKLFSSIEDEGSLTREILDWFSREIGQVKDRADASVNEINSLVSVLGIESSNAEIPNPEIFKQYREKTVGALELVLKKIFSSPAKETISTNETNPSVTTNNSGLPEIFARRGANLHASEVASSVSKKDSQPLIFEFGSILRKSKLGKLLISYWCASSKVYCIEQLEMLQVAIKAVEAFICASFVEDESGQVQLVLPKVLEVSTETLKSLQILLKTNLSAYSVLTSAEILADEQIESVANDLKEMLKNISETFGETLENVRISSACRDFINNL